MYNLISTTNFDLLTVGVAVAAIGLLGFAIYFNNRKSLTNRLFLALSVATIFWGISNYLEYRFTTTTATLWALRTHLFISAWHALIFFSLALVFPAEKMQFPKWYKLFVVPLTVLTAILVYTPFVFSNVAALAPLGEVTNPSRGPGIVLFLLVAFGLLIAGLVVLIVKVKKTRGVERTQMSYVLAGMFVMACLIIAFNLILPVVFNNLQFIPYAALFVLPFIALISYAIQRHHLFNIKVIAVVFVSFIMTAFGFINILFANSASQIAINVTFFAAILIGSIILVRSVLKEVEQRERIQSLADDLSKANESQVALIHFITHQVKGFFTKSRNIFSMLTEGDVGPLTPDQQKYVSEGFDSDTKGVAMVQDVLNAANIRSGIVKYDMAPFDLSTLVGAMVLEYKKMAESKGLEFTYVCWGKDGKDGRTAVAGATGAPAPSYMINGDMEQLRQVFKNLIENSIQYTLHGNVSVRLSQSVAHSAADHTVPPTIVFSVKDTGVGLTDEDKAVLFTQGGHGKDSTQVNVESTGYGLFIAKNIVETHHGRIWAESEGRDKGSAFYVELPGMR